MLHFTLQNTVTLNPYVWKTTEREILSAFECIYSKYALRIFNLHNEFMDSLGYFKKSRPTGSLYLTLQTLSPLVEYIDPESLEIRLLQIPIIFERFKYFFLSLIELILVYDQKSLCSQKEIKKIDLLSFNILTVVSP